MKEIKNLALQFCRFGLVGTFSFVVDYALLIVLTETYHVDYFLSGGISFVISMIINYLLSMRFVFSGKDGMRKYEEIAIFLVLSFIGLLFNQMIMWIVVECFHVLYMIAKLFATLVVTSYNFFSRKAFFE